MKFPLAYTQKGSRNVKKLSLINIFDDFFFIFHINIVLKKMEKKSDGTIRNVDKHLCECKTTFHSLYHGPCLVAYHFLKFSLFIHISLSKQEQYYVGKLLCQFSLMKRNI